MWNEYETFSTVSLLVVLSYEAMELLGLWSDQHMGPIGD